MANLDNLDPTDTMTDDRTSREPNSRVARGISRHPRAPTESVRNSRHLRQDPGTVRRRRPRLLGAIRRQTCDTSLPVDTPEAFPAVAVPHTTMAGYGRPGTATASQGKPQASGIRHPAFTKITTCGWSTGPHYL
jgi:hypothetical protein